MFGTQQEALVVSPLLSTLNSVTRAVSLMVMRVPTIHFHLQEYPSLVSEGFCLF